jgi:hypothetical protein
VGIIMIGNVIYPQTHTIIWLKIESFPIPNTDFLIILHWKSYIKWRISRNTNSQSSIDWERPDRTKGGRFAIWVLRVPNVNNNALVLPNQWSKYAIDLTLTT